MGIVLGFNVAVKDLYLIPILDSRLNEHVQALHFFVGKANYYAQNSSFRTSLVKRATILPNVPDGRYPPIEKTFRIYERMTSTHKDADWYVRCDADSYVVPSVLMQTLSSVDTSLFQNGVAVGGRFAKGRAYERGRLGFGLGFTRYLPGGSCEAVDRRAASRLAGRWGSCLNHSLRSRTNVNLHSDVEVSRCLVTNNVTLLSLSDSFRTLKTSDRRGPLGSEDACANALPREGDGTATMHPFKEPCMHVALSRPAGICDVGKGSPVTSLKADANIPSYVLSFSSQAGRRQIPYPFSPWEVITPFRNPSSVSRFLTKGEISYRETMTTVLIRALQRRQPVFATFDDDVVFRKNFSEQWTRFLSDLTDCSPPREDGGPDVGVVLLGASVWTTRAWTASERATKTRKCVSKLLVGTPGVMGSFAVLWTERAARVALAWLNATDHLYPFDHVWPAMTVAGVPWLFSAAPVAAMHTNHNSSVDERRPSGESRRYELHRWGSRRLYDELR